VEKLFCKNERAIVDLRTPHPGVTLTLVPVAAILVGSIRFNFMDTPLTLAHRGRQSFPCSAAFRKGEELGRFESGSTIVLFASGDCQFCETVTEGATVRMGMPLLRYRP
jgi:phosphatidylserine decarboxylase